MQGICVCFLSLVICWCFIHRSRSQTWQTCCEPTTKRRRWGFGSKLLLVQGCLKIVFGQMYKKSFKPSDDRVLTVAVMSYRWWRFWRLWLIRCQYGGPQAWWRQIRRSDLRIIIYIFDFLMLKVNFVSNKTTEPKPYLPNAHLISILQV